MPAEDRSLVEASFPTIVVGYVVITADSGKLPPGEVGPDQRTPFDGTVAGTERVVLHALTPQEDVIADEKHLLEDVEGESRGMAVDVVGLHALMDEVGIEGDVEGEGSADIV